MSASITVVTRLRVEVRRKRKAPLRLSPLLRHALATARAEKGKTLLLPETIPQKCCYGLFTCPERVRWRVGDGQNHAFFCQSHYDRFMEERDVFDFSSERWTV